jgi:hypothetical protein
MKHEFKTGDGITWKTVKNVRQREEIFKLLKEHKYPLYREYNKNEWWDEFANNFYFNKQGKWCTASVEAVTNPMTFEQITNLIKNGDQPQYEIY